VNDLAAKAKRESQLTPSKKQMLAGVEDAFQAVTDFVIDSLDDEDIVPGNAIAVLISMPTGLGVTVKLITNTSR